MVSRLVVAYFHGTKFKELEIEHNSEYPYNKDTRNVLIDYFIDAGYNVMLQVCKLHLNIPYMIIWVDNRRFQQR